MRVWGLNCAAGLDILGVLGVWVLNWGLNWGDWSYGCCTGGLDGGNWEGWGCG